MSLLRSMSALAIYYSFSSSNSDLLSTEPDSTNTVCLGDRELSIHYRSDIEQKIFIAPRSSPKNGIIQSAA